MSFSSDRVTYRDAKTYFSVILDDKNRRSICRLHFNTSKKAMTLFGPDREERRVPLAAIENLYEQRQGSPADGP
ncbi:MAG: hypothetical protein AAGJ19_17555 [Myxococcota bacterium]